MVKASSGTSIVAKAKRFREKKRKTPPVGTFFPIAHWDLNILNEYYSLKRNVKKENVKLEVRLPLFAWLLMKYAFEASFILMHMVLLYFYFAFSPTFKGKVSFYVGFFIFSYYILSMQIVKLNYRISNVINEIIKVG